MAKVSYYLDTRKKNDSGKSSLLLRITAANKSSAYLKTPYTLTEDDWNKQRQEIRRSCKHYNATKENAKLNEYLNEVNKFIFYNDKLKNCTAKDIKTQFVRSRTQQNKNIFSIIEEYIEIVQQRNPTATTANSYKTLANLIKDFNGNQTDIAEICRPFVLSFITFLEGRNYQKSSIKLVISKLSCIYHFAVNNNYIKDNSQIFRNLNIKREQTRHRIIDKTDLLKIFNFETSHEPTQQAIDLFKLSFCLQGINFKDLLNAKHTDIYNNVLQYKRAKTGKIINVKIEQEAWEIINKYKGKKYLLNFCEGTIKHSYIRQQVNQQLKNIVQQLNININVTTYYARHTWATVARKINIPYDIIREGLGHSNNEVTAIYIKYEPEEVYKANRLVIDYIFDE